MNPSRFLPFLWLAPTLAHATLLSHWKLESSPVDEVAHADAVWGGTAAYTAAPAAPLSNGAAALDGGSFLTAGYNFNFERTQPFTATAWIKGGPQDASIVGDMVAGEGSQGWEMHVGSETLGGNGRSVTVWLINDYPAIAIQVNATADVLDGGWHHIGFTYDGSSTADGVVIYIDGAPAAATAVIDALGGSIANQAAAQLNIGSRMDGAQHPFTGGIDEVGIFDTALTAGEMAAIFQSGIESVSHPYVIATQPQAGQTVDELTAAEVVFSFPVTGVDAADLRINGNPAQTLSATDSKHYRFTFSAPPQGDVHFSWAAGHGITGTNGIPAQPDGWSVIYAPVLPPAQAAIAEFLTKNAGGYEDEDHDTPDWIELINPGTATVDLAGWTLTDDPAVPRKWVLPSVTLNPGQRRIVFASGKDRRNPAGVLHTNFKLADNGGHLALHQPSGQIAHAYAPYPRQEGNVSFGLLAGATPADGRTAWRYLTPTPGTAPAGTTFSGAAILEMTASPAAPVAGEAVTVTIRVSPETNPTLPPFLRYRRMHGGDATLLMRDDGLSGDGAAGDNVYGAVIPPGGAAGEMLRWRVELNSAGVQSRWPINTTTSFPLPLYEGTVLGGEPQGEALPVYQVFVSGYTFPTSASGQTGADSDSGARGALFAYGKLYDNVLFRIKGTTSRYLFKRSHRVDFNPGRDFKWSPDFPAQRELNLNSEYVDPSYLRQNSQLHMHRDSGKAGTPHFPVQLRMNGEVWQLAFHSYSADSELVETMGLDPRGALYKQVGTLATGSGGEKKSRRWESFADLDALRSGINSGASNDSRARYAYDNLNLPAVINYLAVARIAQEADDVWANMVVYRDSENTGEWQPIPFDLNLSLGQLYYGGALDNRTVHADHDSNKSHPLYGSSSCQVQLYAGNGWNRLYNAIIQDPTLRSMLLRRMRTLMDRYLATTAAASPLENRLDSMATLIRPYADADRARWGLPPDSGPYGLGPGISPTQGVNQVKTLFLAPRRTHLYTTHSVNNTGKQIGITNSRNAGIPNPQPAAPAITFGTVLAHPPTGNQNEEYIELKNPGPDAIDVSDWLIRGSTGSFRMKGGTVIAAGGSLYISPNIKAFRSRGTSPRANENRYVTGPYSGFLSPYGETLRLETAAGALVAQTQTAADPAAPPVQLAVTEILSSSAHADNDINGDWFELTNTHTSAVELAGFSWDDNHAEAGFATFPAVTLAAGESLLVLDEDNAGKAATFRSAWGLPASLKILTRADFAQPAGLRGLGNGDSVIIYLPDGTQIARADYPAHTAGVSRAWFTNRNAVPGGYSQNGKFAARFSTVSPADLGSPGFAAKDPATLTAPYDIWAAANDLYSTAATPAADPDGDGRPNRTEFIFGGHPGVADAGFPQSIQTNGSHIDWTVTHRGDDPALVLKVQASADLKSWQTIPASVLSTQPDTRSGYIRTTFRLTPGNQPPFLRAAAE